MKKFTLYILTAFGLMGLATSCNDFGDVNNDPMNLNPEWWIIKWNLLRLKHRYVAPTGTCGVMAVSTQPT